MFKGDKAWDEIRVVKKGGVMVSRMVACKNSRVPVQWANGLSSLSKTDNVMLGVGGGRGRG